MIPMLDMIPCVMGLPVINENLDKLLDAMASFPAKTGLGIILSWAKMIGLCIALGVGANECFQMMLGRRGLDVMKLLHIVIISMCISFAGSIANLASVPGQALEFRARAMANSQNEAVIALEKEVADLQEEYIKKVREQLQKLEENQKAQNAAQADGIVDQVLNSIDEFKTQIQNNLKEWSLLAETKICEWISLIIRYIGEIMFQVSYYGLLVAQRIFLHILAAFAPLMFAISLSPHYKSAWSQWLSKYISVSLWGFVTYLCLYYIDFIMQFNLEQDITSYKSLIGSVSADTDGDAQIGAIGMQAVGSTCMYVVGLLVGVRVIAFVPEVASWLIPGGVASGAGASSSSSGMAVAGAAGGAAATTVAYAATGGSAVAGTIGNQAGRNMTALRDSMTGNK